MNQKRLKTKFKYESKKTFLKMRLRLHEVLVSKICSGEEFDLSVKSSDLIQPTPLGQTGPWARAFHLPISVWPHRCSPGWTSGSTSVRKPETRQHVVVLHRQPLRRLYTLYLSVSHECNQYFRSEVVSSVHRCISEMVEWVGDGLINQWTCEKDEWMDGCMDGGTWRIRLIDTVERWKAGRDSGQWDSPIYLW